MALPQIGRNIVLFVLVISALVIIFFAYASSGCQSDVLGRQVCSVSGVEWKNVSYSPVSNILYIEGKGMHEKIRGVTITAKPTDCITLGQSPRGCDLSLSIASVLCLNSSSCPQVSKDYKYSSPTLHEWVARDDGYFRASIEVPALAHLEDGAAAVVDVFTKNDSPPGGTYVFHVN